jgi:nucleoid-associated protein YgaU
MSAAKEEGETMGIFSKDDPKPKPDFSNVQSGSSSTAPEKPAPPTFEKAAATTYTVVKGDSLSKIAKRQYGDAKKWPVIFEANRDTIKDPDLIHPGQVLKIPAV